MITNINEWRKFNESNEDDTKYADVWNTMSLEDKENHFGDEFDEFFDESDKYLKDVAIEFFNKKWDAIDDKHQARLKYLIGQSEVMSDTAVSEKKKMSKAARKFISNKIKFLIDEEDRPRKQAVAMAYSYAEREGLM